MHIGLSSHTVQLLNVSGPILPGLSLTLLRSARGSPVARQVRHRYHGIATSRQYHTGRLKDAQDGLRLAVEIHAKVVYVNYDQGWPYRYAGRLLPYSQVSFKTLLPDARCRCNSGLNLHYVSAVEVNYLPFVL